MRQRGGCGFIRDFELVKMDEKRLAVSESTYHSILRVPYDAEVPPPDYVALASRHPDHSYLNRHSITLSLLTLRLMRIAVLFQRVCGKVASPVLS